MTNLKVSDITEANNDLQFNIENVNVSIINAIRRTILSDISILVFKTTPYEQNLANITVNTSRFNNEIIKQRLSCIPIHIKDLDVPYDNLLVVVDVINDTSQVKHVTTEDFKIKDTSTDTFVSKTEVQKIFPKNNITNHYIQFLKLRPKMGDNLKGEELQLSAKLSIGTAKESGMFNVAYVCSFSNILDTEKVKEKWSNKAKELKESGMKQENIDNYKTNWMLLDAKRIYKNDTFQFILKSIGIYTPTELIKLACDIIIKQLNNIATGSGFTVKNNETTMKNAFDIVFDDEDYTIGKVLEYMFYDNYYINSDILAYVSFYKSHPHNIEAILRIAYNNSVETTAVTQFITSVCTNAIAIFEEIKNLF